MCLQNLGMSQHNIALVAVCAVSWLYDEPHLLHVQDTACDTITGMLLCEEQLVSHYQLASCLEVFASCLES